jgi:putative tricarboxylic transport membrane protein
MQRLRLLFLAAVLSLVTAGSALAFEPGNTECVAPANPGGGWDFTCRQVGKTLYDLKLVPGPVQVTNMPGAGGGVAYGYVVSKRNDDPNLLVAASTSTTTRLAQGKFPGMDKEMVQWVGALGADYGVIAVAKDSPFKNLGDLLKAIKRDPSKVAIAGGSAVGGWDHFKVLIAAKAAGVKNLTKVKYIAFQGGGEAITQVLGGHVQAYTGDVSEIQGHLESGGIRILAVLSEERLPGAMSDVPTAREQGVDAVCPNWRGFYLPKEASVEAYNYWAGAMETLYNSPEWKQIMTDNGLMPFFKKGADFETFVAKQVADIRELSKELGIVR